MEIERKYLVANLPDGLAQCPHEDIEQAYLCTNPTVRVRKYGNRFWLTVKAHQVGCHGVIVNREEEFELSVDSYLKLKAKCEGLVVKKTRYRVNLENGLVAELDIFHDAHEGLRLVEVEFSTVEQAEKFIPPEWFGRDVSDDLRYRNSSLTFSMSSSSLPSE